MVVAAAAPTMVPMEDEDELLPPAPFITRVASSLSSHPYPFAVLILPLPWQTQYPYSHVPTLGPPQSIEYLSILLSHFTLLTSSSVSASQYPPITSFTAFFNLASPA